MHEPRPAQNRARNFTMGDLMLMMLLFGGQLAAAHYWLSTFQTRPETYLIVLLAVLSLFAAGMTLLLVSKVPHGRKTTPLRFLIMIIIDVALFLGFPVAVLLVLAACILIFFTFPISVPLLFAARESVRLFLKAQAARMSEMQNGGPAENTQAEQLSPAQTSTEA